MQKIQRPRAMAIPAFRAAEKSSPQGPSHEPGTRGLRRSPGSGPPTPCPRRTISSATAQDGIQAPRQEPLLVLGDQADREQHGGAVRRARGVVERVEPGLGNDDSLTRGILRRHGAEDLGEQREVSMTCGEAFVGFMGSPFPERVAWVRTLSLLRKRPGGGDIKARRSAAPFVVHFGYGWRPRNQGASSGCGLLPH